ncbi:hypothetical protein ABZP36_034768, partial [Zizania latifolia]
ECPAHLKEGICSLIFASPRCSQLPELNFVSAAVDLRPDACVNNLLIEKLSVKKPSRQTRLKILKEIAKEHQIDWQGPTTFVEATNLLVKTTLSTHVVSRHGDDHNNEHTMQFKDVASGARAAAESAERAASAATATVDLANKKTPSSDEVKDRIILFHESTHSSKRQLMSKSSRSSRSEDVVTFDDLKPKEGRLPVERAS